MIGGVARELLFWKWWLEGRIGTPVSAAATPSLTVVIPAYHERRSRNIDPLVRACLRCPFITRIVISNHNPRVRMDGVVRVRSPRVTVLEQGERRGCGHAWSVIRGLPGDSFLVIDDDQLLTPVQIATLFARLVERPDVPHGLCGGRGGGAYLERCEAEVDVLYNVYAVTRAHVAAFHELSARLIEEHGITPEELEYSCDDLVISRAGTGSARIHDAGFVLRCRTGGQQGVAIFREAGFDARRAKVEAALARL